MYNEQYTLVMEHIQVCMTLANIIGEDIMEKRKKYHYHEEI